MHIDILLLGKTKENFLSKGVEEYCKRLKHYVSCSFIQVKEVRKKNVSVDTLKNLEGQQLLAAVKDNSYIVALDERGKQVDSVQFAEMFSTWEQSNKKNISFIIGGPNGLSDDVRQRADFLLGLSRMTFTHDMIRLFLVEQIYRAYTIKNNEQYHK